MRLILHIGTGKTGTTALQQFLSVNRTTLSTNGVYYATPADEHNFNSVVKAHLLPTQHDVMGRFFIDHLSNAERRGFHTTVASSENLYCMTRHSYDPATNKFPADPLAEERFLIARLRSAIPNSVDVRIVCYVRRPDHYLESTYTQRVKGGLFAGNIAQFVSIGGYMLDYHRCLSIWREVFGNIDMAVRLYETALPSVMHDFFRYVLHLQDSSSFAKAGLRANERLSRDLIEYIRLLNEDSPCSKKTFDQKIYALVDKRIANPSSSYEYLSPDERAGLLSRLEPSMERLRTEFSLPPFPPFSLEAARASWQPYPGLSLEKRQEIEFHYNAVQRQVGFRLERLLLRAASLARRRLPFLSWLLDFARGSGLRRLLLEATSRIQ
jgi:hypothetical protein